MPVAVAVGADLSQERLQHSPKGARAPPAVLLLRARIMAVRPQPPTTIAQALLRPPRTLRLPAAPKETVLAVRHLPHRPGWGGVRPNKTPGRVLGVAVMPRPLGRTMGPRPPHKMMAPPPGAMGACQGMMPPDRTSSSSK